MAGILLAHEQQRRVVRRRQVDALPEGPTVVSGTGAYGTGGLGRHLAELVEALRERDSLLSYLCPGPRPGDAADVGRRVEIPRWAERAMEVPPIRFSLGRRALLGNAAFDAAAARRIPQGGQHLMAFNGAALRQIGVGRRMGYRSIALISANGHLARVARLHEKAWRQYPVERPWGPALLQRNLAEYDAADHIYVSSRYAWESFVGEGVPADRVRMFPLTPHERFQPRPARAPSSTFDMVYVGSLSVDKGVPLLIDAFSKLRFADARLTLVGGWGTRGMRRLVESACSRDRRISARPGDPLPHLLKAAVYVHPSYSEGAPYALAEARACGVPVIVTEDSAQDEPLGSTGDCVTVPTGDVDALAGALLASYEAGR